jgi:hypothetical protein
MTQDSRHGESFEGDVLSSTLTEKLGTRNAEGWVRELTF